MYSLSNYNLLLKLKTIVYLLYLMYVQVSTYKVNIYNKNKNKIILNFVYLHHYYQKPI